MVSLEKSLPRWGVPTVITRRIDGLGLKKKLASIRLRTARSAFSREKSWSLTSFQKSSRLWMVWSRERQAPHAVADQDHLVQGRLAVVRVDNLTRLGQVFAKVGGP